MHPAATQRFGGFLRTVPVTEHHVGALDDDFADGAARHFVVVLVDDHHAHPQRRAARRAYAAIGDACGAVAFRAVAGDDRRGFGHAVAVGEFHARQTLQRQFQHRCGDRRGAVGHALEAGKVMAGEFRMHDQSLQHGRHQEDVGDTLTLDGLHEFKRLKRGHEDVRFTDNELHDHPRQAGGMEHRCDV
ncbi:hypothetical protein D9M68_283540 [compost metagenome]